MEAAGAGPAADVDFPDLDKISVASAWPALGALQRRAVLAEYLGVPVQQLSSSLREQAAHRIGQARSRSERAARYRPALRASATAALTAQRNIAWVQAQVTGRASQNASVRLTRGGVAVRSDSEESGQEHGSGDGASPSAAAGPNPPSAPSCAKPALNTAQLRGDNPLSLVQQHQQQASPNATADADATKTALPSSSAQIAAAGPSPPINSTRSTQLQPNKANPQAGSGHVFAASASTANPPAAEPPQPRSGLAPIWVGRDLTLCPEAWERLLNAIEAAVVACDKAGAARCGADSLTPAGAAAGAAGGRGFSAKLRRSDAQEQLEDAAAALEELREAAAQLPPHRVVWHLMHAATDGLAAEGASPQPKAPTKQNKSDAKAKGAKSEPEPVLGAMQLYALALLRANVILSRPHPMAFMVPAPGAAPDRQTHGGEAATVTAAAAVAVAAHDRRREEHRRGAALLMEVLLKPALSLPYPELVAAATVQAELCPLLKLADMSPGGGGGDTDSPPRRGPLPEWATDRGLPVRLARRCVEAMAAHASATRRSNRPGKSPGAASGPGEGGSASWGSSSAAGGTVSAKPGAGATASDDDDSADDDDDDNRPFRRPKGVAELRPFRQDARERHPGGGKPHESWLEVAVRPLEELAAAAARAHVAAASAARERCLRRVRRAMASGVGSVESQWQAAYLEAFQAEYEDALRGSGGAVEAAAAGDRKRGGGGGGGGEKTAATLAEVDGDLLRAVLCDMHGLARWDDGGGDGGGGAWRRKLALGQGVSGEPCALVGLGHNLAVGLWRGSEGDSAEGGGDGKAGGDAKGGAAAAGAGGGGKVDIPIPIPIPIPDAGAVALHRMALAEHFVEAALYSRPCRLVALGAAALRSVVAAACAMGLIRQGPRPHPDVLGHSPGALPARSDGPVLLCFELMPPLPPPPPPKRPQTGPPAPPQPPPLAAGVGSRAIALVRRVVGLGKEMAGGEDGTSKSKGERATGKGSAAAAKPSAAAIKGGAAPASKSGPAAGKGKSVAAAVKGGPAPAKGGVAAARDVAAAPAVAAVPGDTAAARDEAHEGDTVAPPAEERLAVTVVSRGAAAGLTIRRLCRQAREARRAFTIEVPSDGFTGRDSDGGSGGGSPSGGSGGSGGKPGGRRGGGGAAAAASGLAGYKQQLLRILGDSGCAWLHCPDRLALQAAALLVAEVHRDLQEEQRSASRGGANGRGSAAAAAAVVVGSESVPPGLEVLPHIGGPWCELRARQARDRILRDLQVAMRTPPASQAARGREAGAAGARRDGGSDSGGPLEGGWDAIWRLAVNREACVLMGELDGSLGGLPALWGAPPPVSALPSTTIAAAAAGEEADDAAGPSSVARGLAGRGAPEVAASGKAGGAHVTGPEAVSLLVLRQLDLERAEGRGGWV